MQKKETKLIQMSIPVPQQNESIIEFIDKWIDDQTFVMQFPSHQTRLGILEYVYVRHKTQEVTITQLINYDKECTNNTSEIES